MVTNERFVRVWMETYHRKEQRGVAKVAAKLGINKKSASVRAYKLRKAGVQLPKLSRHSEIDVEALNDLIVL